MPKTIKKLSVFVLFYLVSCSFIFSQAVLPPKTGTYVCALLSEQVQFTTGLNTSLVTGETKLRVGNDKNMTITASRAPFDIVLKSGGTYTLTNVKTDGGSYKFNPQNNKISFTGDLTLLNFKNYFFVKNTYVLQFDSNTGLHWQCELGTQSNNTITSVVSNEKINSGLTGTIMTTVSNQGNNFLANVFEFSLSKGTYNIIFPDGVAAQNTKGDILHFDKNSRLKITDKTGKTTIKQLTEKVNYGFDEMYPAISTSGEYIALTFPNKSKTGTMSDLAANGVKVVIIGVNNQSISEFLGYQQAAWMPDGRLIVAGDGKSKQGLFIIDANFKTIKRLVEDYNTAQLPAVSYDGKYLAFVYNGEVWVMNLKTNSMKKVIYGTPTGFPTWSPDGKYLAVNVIDPSSKKWLVYVCDWTTEKGFWVKDVSGNFVESQNRLTWLP
jgi:WD40-like Beta Propeller Repeat